ncbi:hypothetical protein [Bradyrhizobium retamae]|uniref:Uncharacterized protein n=1 Tax=Bradyrhizobium retamae TaxID=1300035 RepID=A0A0R3MJ16_9BRAD|nr:hypothetical protein CQ13_08500 [Bradyrhizobium retamae]
MSLFQASDRVSFALDRQAASVRLIPLLYGLTLFVSALLLFSIQPMFAKMVLPKLGGAPAVWSVAMVFFQTVLLAGYAYAHFLNRLLRPGRAAMVHLLLVGITAMTLPIAIAPGWIAPPSYSFPGPWNCHFNSCSRYWWRRCCFNGSSRCAFSGLSS